jgi:hypothetical protein
MLRELAETADRARWRALLPGLSGLHIEETAAAAPVVALDEELRQGLLDAVLAEGYYQHGPVLPADTIRALAAAVVALRAAGHPLELAFVFDELWQIAHWLKPLFELVLGTGFRQLPALTIWHVGGGGDGSGWAPHRDRRGTLRSNGMPAALSAWLALTDATPLNGCIHVLPKGLDRYYGSGEVGEVDLATLQNVRALPAPAGSFLFWNHELLHWGGRASMRAPRPRISVGIELQRGDLPPFRAPLTDPLVAPPLEWRLGLIGHSILAYQTMRPTSDEHLALARRLVRFLG